jgi:REP element-mobilizing transposase RayT
MTVFKHLRRNSLRLKGFDYSTDGAYFITICTNNRICYFGEVANGQMNLNNPGSLVKESWIELPEHFKDIVLDEFVVMPNHVHGIIIILKELKELQENNRGKNYSYNKGSMNQIPTGTALYYPLITISLIIRYYKAKTSKVLHDKGNLDFRWQRNFYDHIIRNETDFKNIQEYIFNNPQQWEFDRENIYHKYRFDSSNTQRN